MVLHGDIIQDRNHVVVLALLRPPYLYAVFTMHGH